MCINNRWLDDSGPDFMGGLVTISLLCNKRRITFGLTSTQKSSKWTKNDGSSLCLVRFLEFFFVVLHISWCWVAALDGHARKEPKINLISQNGIFTKLSLLIYRILSSFAFTEWMNELVNTQCFEILPKKVSYYFLNPKFGVKIVTMRMPSLVTANELTKKFENLEKETFLGTFRTLWL